MASYEIAFKPSVEKDLRIVTAKVRARILSRIAGLREEPIPRQAIELAGGHAWYRLRAGDYRIVYGVDFGTRQVVVQYVRHRRDAYRRR